MPRRAGSTVLSGASAHRFRSGRRVGQTIAVRLGLVQRATGGQQPRFAVRRLHQPENSDVRRRGRSDCGHAVTRPFRSAELCRRLAVLRQRLLEFLFDTEGIGGARARIPAGHGDCARASCGG
jgi:hypothetical protein